MIAIPIDVFFTVYLRFALHVPRQPGRAVHNGSARSAITRFGNEFRNGDKFVFFGHKVSELYHRAREVHALPQEHECLKEIGLGGCVVTSFVADEQQLAGSDHPLAGCQNPTTAKEGRVMEFTHLV